MNPKSYALFRGFDPTQGKVIREPIANEPGYWVGAPSVTFDDHSGETYLVYRIRRPRGVEPDRGAEIRIARSKDGIHFDDIWTGTKDQLNTTSIERCTLVKIGNEWVLYVSYVDPIDQRWRTDLVRADAPDAFDLKQVQPVLTAADIDAEGVKDPFLIQIAGQYQMIVSYAIRVGMTTDDELHGTSDAYNTGHILSATGLATSPDGYSWTWQGGILMPSESGWDCYAARIGCLWYQAPVWLALYDGSADVSENYEERCGLAWSATLTDWQRVTEKAPLMQPPHGPSALRYFDILDFEKERFFYYEMARPDGSHDLRVYHHSL